MFISFFSKTEYVTGADYSQNPDCIHQENLEMNVDTQEPVLTGSKGNYKIEILDKAIPAETAMQKHARIKQALLSTEDISDFDLEWEQFSDIEIGDIITARIFQGNPYAQLVLQAKVTKALLRALAGNPSEGDDVIIATGDTVTAQINEIRNVFGLWNM